MERLSLVQWELVALLRGTGACIERRDGPGQCCMLPEPAASAWRRRHGGKPPHMRSVKALVRAGLVEEVRTPWGAVYRADDFA